MNIFHLNFYSLTNFFFGSINFEFRPINSLEQSGLQEGNQIKIQNQSFSGKLPRTINYSFNLHKNNKQVENNILNNNNNNIIQKENKSEESYPQMSIRERIACIRQNSSNWRERVEKEEPNLDRSCDINKIRLSLVEKQESWKQRVDYKNDYDFPIFERNKKTNDYTSLEPLPSKCLHSQDLTTNTSKCLPVEPIIRNTSKENRPGK
ncbi:unnamed protein product [Schistosoma margrebowiei]|uniref:Uncharacterized protein n=1 Tax=Schistosoma margrebowiei TaxID=48269 RepID=A0A3P8DID4_9TREM|nr:unnamed protein product [Schistosoma margrebowiei]